MPNCDFYGTIKDHEPILDFLYSNGECDIYELGSEPSCDLRHFRSSEEVLSLFDNPYPNGKQRHSIHLQLYVKGTGPEFVPTRISLDPDVCNGHTFRYSAEGKGLVQLYLSTLDENSLRSSHTNHFSQKGAEKWSDESEDLRNASSWDFKAITSFSSKLNRFIRKMKVAKIGGRVLLPGGLKAWDDGFSLPPFRQDKTKIERFELERK